MLQEVIKHYMLMISAQSGECYQCVLSKIFTPSAEYDSHCYMPKTQIIVGPTYNSDHRLLFNACTDSALAPVNVLWFYIKYRRWPK